MSDELDQDQDLTLDGELDLETDQDGTEDIEALKQELAKKDEIIQQQQARLKAKPRIKSDPYDDAVVKDVQYLKTLEEKRQYGYENGLSPQETDYAFKFAGGKPTKEILEDPFFKGGLESFRSMQRVEANIPNSSSSAPVFGDKPFSEIPDDERAKRFESRMKQIK